ncbi:MAG: PIN domain-containing protein [Rhodocyclaceae bacterium]|nr:PIN domain-containing protein [Rhodocyclaceae bacterium]
MRNILIDSGPLIAFFSPDDVHRPRYEGVLTECAATGIRLVTTWPCIIEAAYLLAPTRRFEFLHWIALGGVMVYPLDTGHLDDMLVWMRRYTEPGKCEMDMADASLYWLSVDTGITEIMTVDRRDFERYRLPDGRCFSIV